MKLAIVDTNVASFLLGNKLERELYRGDLEGRRIEVSFQTVAELLYDVFLDGEPIAWHKGRVPSREGSGGVGRRSRVLVRQDGERG